MMFFRFLNGYYPCSLWMQNRDLTHRNFISSGMINQAALQANLAVVKIAEPPVSYQGLSISGRAKVFVGNTLRRLIGEFLAAARARQPNVKFCPQLVIELTNG